MGKRLVDLIQDEMEKKAIIMCKKFCKYNEEMEKEKDEGKSDKLFLKYCCHCPMLQFFE